MPTIQSGSYGGNIHKRNDGAGFDVYFLYNMSDPTHFGSTGDVESRKTYKTEKMARAKIAAYIARNAA